MREIAKKMFAMLILFALCGFSLSVILRINSAFSSVKIDRGVLVMGNIFGISFVVMFLIWGLLFWKEVYKSSFFGEDGFVSAMFIALLRFFWLSSFIFIIIDNLQNLNTGMLDKTINHLNIGYLFISLFYFIFDMGVTENWRIEIKRLQKESLEKPLKEKALLEVAGRDTDESDLWGTKGENGLISQEPRGPENCASGISEKQKEKSIEIIALNGYAVCKREKIILDETRWMLQWKVVAIPNFVVSGEQAQIHLGDIYSFGRHDLKKIPHFWFSYDCKVYLAVKSDSIPAVLREQ